MGFTAPAGSSIISEVLVEKLASEPAMIGARLFSGYEGISCGFADLLAEVCSRCDCIIFAVMIRSGRQGRG